MSATEKARPVRTARESTARMRAWKPAGRLRRGTASADAGRIAAAVVLLLAPVVYSYTTTMLRPSSLPLGIRSVEWLRTHHGAWLVNESERLYYTWNAPAKGGPALRMLPTVGVGRACGGSRAIRAHAGRRGSCRSCARLSPARGSGDRPDGSSTGASPVLVTTFRSEAAYPRIVAYVAWFDHTRTQLALYPGRYEPPGASPRGPMEVPRVQRWRLLATFNSGFLHRDSNGGFFVNGDSVAPLRQGQGTIVAYKNGRVDVVSWRGGVSPRGDVVLARQNLPLIVAQGTAESLCSPTGRSGEARSATRYGSGGPAPASTGAGT